MVSATFDHKRALSGRGACLPFGNIAKIWPLLDLGLLGMLIPGVGCAVDTARIEPHGTYIAQGGGQKLCLLVSESLDPEFTHSMVGEVLNLPSYPSK